MNPEAVRQPADMPHQTVDEIIAKVNGLLKTALGRKRISEFQKTVSLLSRHADGVGRTLKLVRSVRPPRST